MITLAPAGEQVFFRSALERLHTVVHLYANDRDPRRVPQVDDFIEVNGHGYFPILLGPEEWRFRVTRRNRLMAEASVEWTFAQGPRQMVHGYFVTSQSDAEAVLWADRLERPVELLNNGEHLAILMQLSPFRRRTEDAARRA